MVSGVRTQLVASESLSRAVFYAASTRRVNLTVLNVFRNYGVTLALARCPVKPDFTSPHNTYSVLVPPFLQVFRAPDCNLGHPLPRPPFHCAPGPRSVRNRIYRGHPTLLLSKSPLFAGRELSTFLHRTFAIRRNGLRERHGRSRNLLCVHLASRVRNPARSSIYLPFSDLPSLSLSGQSYRIRSQSRLRPRQRRRPPSVLRQTSPPIVSGGRAVGCWNVEWMRYSVA